MRRLLATLALTLLALVATVPAEAAYGEGSRLTADAPVSLAGRVDAGVSHGHASFLAPDARTTLSASLTADEMHLTRTVVANCTAPVSECPMTPAAQEEPLLLRSATVRVVRALEAYKLVLTNDDSHADTASFGAPGPILASSGATTTLDVTREARAISPYGPAWSTEEPRASTDDVYTVDAGTAFTLAKGGTLSAIGGFEVLYQGLELEVKGVDENGQAFETTYRTGSSNAIEFVVIEVKRGILHAASTSAELSAYRVRAADTRGSATFTNAVGTVTHDDGPKTYDRETVTLPGPLELIVTGVESGSTPRLTLAISSHLAVLDAVPPASDDPTTASDLAVAGAMGAGGAAFLAGLAYFWPRLRFAAMALMLPLYTRIQRTEVLEHEKRDEIYELIRAAPGIHAHEIGAKAQIGWGTTVYHLKLLESHHLVVSKRSGRYKRFFVNTGEYTKKKDVYGALRNDTARAIADFIARHPGTTQKDLCTALGLAPSLVSWHVQKLEAVDLVKRVKDGRLVRYYAGAAWTDVAPNGTLSTTGGESAA